MGTHKLISRERALDLVLGGIDPLEAIGLPLEETLGYIAADDIYASRDIPGFDRASMDGYAICSKDTSSATAQHPVLLKVTGKLSPDAAESTSIKSGHALRIMTGNPIPSGADAVVKEEDVQVNDQGISVSAVVRPSQHILRRGNEMRGGSLIVERGRPITPVVQCMLASLQITEVAVTRKPEVCIVAIGNELIDLRDKLTDYSIVASNIHVLTAMVRQHGGKVRHAKISKDNKNALRKDIEEGLKGHMLITTGGTSNARSDLTRTVIQDLGIDLTFEGVSMKPGKGTCFGLDHNIPVFCLPGTPSAVHVAFYAFVLPALFRLLGLTVSSMSTVNAILAEDVKKKPGIEYLVHGLVSRKDASYAVLPLVGPDVDAFSAMERANGLIIIAPDKSHLRQGQTVSVQLLNPSEPFLVRRAEPIQKGMLKHEEMTPPIVSIVGKSDAGKTTLLEKLVRELKARGYRIGTIKHDVHGFDIDHEGKDSWRHKQAGAWTVVISSPKKVAIIKDIEREETVDGLAKKYFSDVDIILTEGYKREDKSKIEIFRSQVHEKPLCTKDDHLVALVSDIPMDLGVPRFQLDDTKPLADFVEQTFLTKSPHPIGNDVL